MGYRADWLMNTGRATRHVEAVLWAFDKEVNPASPVRLLDVGLENGGSAAVWRRALPEGSEVVTMDSDPRTEPDLLVDVTDAEAVRAALRGQWFDYIVDDTRAEPGHEWVLWPFLRAGGLLLVEGSPVTAAMDLAPFLLDGDSWLPMEEVLRVTVWPGLFVVEKRHPRVAPYMEVMSGEDYPVVGAETLMDAGVKKVVL